MSQPGKDLLHAETRKKYLSYRRQIKHIRKLEVSMKNILYAIQRKIKSIK